MKTKFPRADALAVAKELCDALKIVTERLIVAGSLRRRKAFVGDVEILYIPRVETYRGGFFAEDDKVCNMADECLNGMLKAGVIAKRTNVNGSQMWGEKNKLAVHVKSGIPVDFFAATESNWFNYLVCRTGPGDMNIAIASAAQNLGWKWNPYGDGFSRHSDIGMEEHVVCSEADVFNFVGLPYRDPWER